MNPNQPVPPPQILPNTGHSGHNPYEFIVAGKQTKRSSFLGGGSFFGKIALILGSAIVLIVVIVLISSALSPKGINPKLTDIAEQQQEIVRVAEAASQQAVGQDTKNFVTNVTFSVSSGQQQILGYLEKHGTKVSAKTLALKQDSQTDTLLTNAATAGNFDSAATQKLASSLQTYISSLKDAYNQTSSADLKQILQSDYASAQVLATQAKSLQTSN